MKELILTWYVENYSCCWHGERDTLFSPSFDAETFEKTIWTLIIYPNRFGSNEYISFSLLRGTDNGPGTFTVNPELSLLAADGSLLESRKFFENEYSLEKGRFYECANFVKRCKVLIEKRDVYLPQDTLTVRCRMWEGTGDVSDTTEIFARTRIGVERISFAGVVNCFSVLPLNLKYNVSIKSSKIRSLIMVDVSLISSFKKGVMVGVFLNTHKEGIRFISLKLSLLTATGKPIECGQEDASLFVNQTQPLLLSFPKKVLLERKNEYLPRDTLCLYFDVTFSTGFEIDKVVQTVCDGHLMPKLKPSANDGNTCKACANLHVLGSAYGDFRSLYNNQIMSDIKLNAKTESFSAHKTVLCVRSPVFRAMFVNDMKEKTNGCIEVPDLEDETMRRFLLFLYSHSVGDLEWDIASKLYYAADKYQVQLLKAICSSFMMDNLNASNVSELLVLADMHQDVDLKVFVEDFILQNDEEVFGSEKWETFMETNPHLAMATMHLKYKRKPKI